MLQNCAAAALRNLGANRLHAAISILGLAIGLAAVFLAGVYLKSELSFDSFIPGAGKVFVVTSDLQMPGQAPVVTDYAPAWLAPRLEAGAPQVQRTARLAYDQVSVRRGERQGREELAWVDPSFFDVLPLPALAGDPRTALEDPDAVVLTREVARRYFGRDAPLGETLELEGKRLLRVAAVLRDLPAESHLSQQIFASGRAGHSLLSRLTESPGAARNFASWVVTPRPDQNPPARFESVRLRTYVQLASPEHAPATLALMRRLLDVAGQADVPEGSTVEFGLTPLQALHLQQFRGANLGAGDVRTSQSGLLGVSVAAGLVLVLAIINFVNLTTARGARRAVEVGVRKAAGAQRRHLVLQFIGEACLQAAFAMVLALAIAELALPPLNGFLGRNLTFTYWSAPALIALALGVLALGVAAGAYPALVLSRFRPAAVLKGGSQLTSGSGWIREGLVAFQFVVLVVLILAVVVVWRQTQYAMDRGLRMQTDHVLAIQTTPCRGSFEDEVRRLPGVQGVACSSRNLLGLDAFDPVKFVMNVTRPGGPELRADLGLVDYGWFELYGVEPLAGRLFSRDRPGDELPVQAFPEPQRGPVVLNETAARKLGFPNPEAALDQRIAVGPGYGEFHVIGVTPDVTLDLKSGEVQPLMFLVDFANYPADQVLSIKLDGARVPETLREIDRIWRETGGEGAVHRQFLEDYIGRLYVGVIRQGALVTALCALAVVLACLGLLGLAAFTAERRIKEIGVRKALGAGVSDIIRLLIGQFLRPVLIACVVAWPIGWWVMGRWLEGFAYRVPLSPWMFLASGAAAAVIASATVFAHAARTARSKPIAALRYE